MKKETIFKHELNESMQANAALNCLKNRNTPKKLNESTDFDARFEFRKDLRELASPIAKKAYMIIRKQYGDGMWRRLYMDDCDERGLIDMLNMYAEKGLNPQQIVNKMLGVREDEEEDVDFFDLAVEIAKKNAKKIARMSELNACSILMRELCKLTNRDYDSLDEESDFDKYRDAASYGYYSVVSYDDEDDDDEEEEEMPQMERHDIALATTYCLGESFIDNDGDLDDIYYAVLKVFDSTYDAPATTDYEDVLQWCRKHYKQIEKLITTEEQEEQIFKVRTKQGFVEVPLSSEVVDAFHDNLDPRYDDMDTQAALKGINGGARLAALIAGMMEQGYKPTPDELHILELHYNAKKDAKQSQADSSNRNMNAYSD